MSAHVTDLLGQMGCESNRMPEQEMNFIFDYEVKVYTVVKQ